MNYNQELYLRKADERDRDILLEWANEAKTRRQSFQNHRITPEEHERWFQNALRNENIQILILHLHEKPIGTMRLLIEDTCAVLSYSIGSDYRGIGLGKKLIKMTADYAQRNLDLLSLRAVTKVDNIASQNVLLKNGFLLVEILPDHKGFVFVKDLEPTDFL